MPVGACIVAGDAILAVAGNRTRTDQDPTAHAEIVALRAASGEIANYRISGAVVYSTIEPCVMCAGALIQARVERLVYGARDERAGAVESRFRVCDTDFLNHRIEITAGVLEEECREIMQEFFRARRGKTDAIRSDIRGQLESNNALFLKSDPLTSDICLLERSHSGLVHRSRKPEWGKLHRGFKSHPLRHQISDFGLRIADLQIIEFS